MRLTEEIAKLKMCHRWSVIHIQGSRTEPVERECIASRCMAWRWDESSFKRYNKDKNLCKWEDSPQAEWRGYCGLGGKP